MSDVTVEDSPVPLPLVVNEVPLTPVLRLARLRKMLVRIGEDVLSLGVFSAAVVGLILPPVLFFFSGLWNTWTYITGIWTLWHEVTAWRIADMFTSLVAVDTASRFALTSVSYFALVFSFMVLFAGLLGRRWQHIFVVPGILLCAPTSVIFTVAATLSFSVLAARLHLPEWLQYPLVGYVLLDALLLAALLLDLRPATRRNWLARRRRRHEAALEAVSFTRPTPLPLVHFGPSQSVTDDNAVGTLTQPATVLGTSSPIPDSEHEAQSSISSVPDATHNGLPDTLHALVATEIVSTSSETSAETEAAVATSNSTA